MLQDLSLSNKFIFLNYEIYLRAFTTSCWQDKIQASQVGIQGSQAPSSVSPIYAPTLSY